MLHVLTSSKKFTCQICGKAETVGYNRPHSLHRSKKLIKPNVQKIGGKYLCTRCLRSLVKSGKNA